MNSIAYAADKGPTVVVSGINMEQRFKFPLVRATLAGTLATAGTCLLISAAALPSIPCLIAGALCIIPGYYASYAYYKLRSGNNTAFKLEEWYDRDESEEQT